MDTTNEVMFAKSLSSIGRLQHPSGFLECLQLLAEIKTGDIHNDVKQRNSCTGVGGRLISHQS